MIYNKSQPLAPLSCTIEADERMGADGAVVRKLNKSALTKELKRLKKENIEALTISLVNSYANPAHEKEVEKIAKQVLPGIPVSLSYDVVPEMQEYERTITTVANSYVPGGLGGWVIYNKSQPLAPLSCTIEADERMSADGSVGGN